MILVVLCLAAVIALSGGFIVGVAAGVVLERGRRDAGGIAPHEALRQLAGDTSDSAGESAVRPIPAARGDWWGV